MSLIDLPPSISYIFWSYCGSAGFIVGAYLTKVSPLGVYIATATYFGSLAKRGLGSTRLLVFSWSPLGRIRFTYNFTGSFARGTSESVAFTSVYLLMSPFLIFTPYGSFVSICPIAPSQSRSTPSVVSAAFLAYLIDSSTKSKIGWNIFSLA